MPARDFMRPGVVTLPGDASLLDAKRALVRHYIHAVLIVDTDRGRPLAWLERTTDGPCATSRRHAASPGSRGAPSDFR